MPRAESVVDVAAPRKRRMRGLADVDRCLDAADAARLVAEELFGVAEVALARRSRRVVADAARRASSTRRAPRRPQRAATFRTARGARTRFSRPRWPSAAREESSFISSTPRAGPPPLAASLSNADRRDESSSGEGTPPSQLPAGRRRSRSSAFAVARGRPLDRRLGGGLVLASRASRTGRFGGNRHHGVDITLRRSKTSACASAAARGERGGRRATRRRRRTRTTVRKRFDVSRRRRLVRSLNAVARFWRLGRPLDDHHGGGDRRRRGPGAANSMPVSRARRARRQRLSRRSPRVPPPAPCRAGSGSSASRRRPPRDRSSELPSTSTRSASLLEPAP